MDEVNVNSGLLDQPSVPVNFVPATAGDIYPIGTTTIRIIEDGSHTDNRLAAAELTIPPHTTGPVPHWHEMHDETFLVTKGTVRFHLLNEEYVDAKEGDYVAVPVRAPHTFSNPFDEEAKFFNTYTPAFFINYFKLVSGIAEAGKPFSPEVNKNAMALYATLLADLKKK